MADITFLKQFTEARIGLGHTGTSIPVQQSLEFKLAHAHARDAVYSEMDVPVLISKLKTFNLPVAELHSQASSRAQYLQRPDMGRRLNEASAENLNTQNTGCDVVICIADGLSAFAIDENAAGLLRLLIPKLQQGNFSLGPICLVEQGRVAIADDIGERLNAKLAVILIGERPGLSAADSMGVYLTYEPKRGLTDDSRNCISNIRAGGLTAVLAADKIFYLIAGAFHSKLSGIKLKDNEGRSLQ